MAYQQARTQQNGVRMIEDIYPIHRTIDDHIDVYEAIGIEG